MAGNDESEKRKECQQKQICIAEEELHWEVGTGPEVYVKDTPGQQGGIV